MHLVCVCPQYVWCRQVFVRSSRICAQHEKLDLWNGTEVVVANSLIKALKFGEGKKTFKAQI